MCENVKICTEMEAVNIVSSIQSAIEENSNNLHNPNQIMGLRESLSGVFAPSIAIPYSKVWARGRTLKISFLGDIDSHVHEGIVFYAKQWLEFADLTFDFIDSNRGDIRVSVAPNGKSWSYVGTDAKLIHHEKPTMNFGWLKSNSPDYEYSRVVLHEFGHALGAIHEHERPDSRIPWNVEKVYAYYAKFNWSKEEVDNNIFSKYSEGQLNASEYDMESIMHYAIPNELTHGDWMVPWNTRLSDQDKDFIAKQY